MAASLHRMIFEVDTAFMGMHDHQATWSSGLEDSRAILFA